MRELKNAIDRALVLGRDAQHVRPVDQALGAQKADGQLVLVAGSPHRHGNGDRLLTRPGGPDFEGLLADHPIRANLQRVAPDRDDPRRRHVACGWLENLVGALGHHPSIDRAYRSRT